MYYIKFKKHATLISDMFSSSMIKKSSTYLEYFNI